MLYIIPTDNFLSGYGIYKGYSERRLGWSFLWKRIKAIYIPYIIITLILFAINLVLGFKRVDFHCVKGAVVGNRFQDVVGSYACLADCFCMSVY